MRPDLSIGAALPPAGRQRRGGGSPGAWRARAARATMRGWLVMTDSWAQFYRVLLMVLLDGTRPSEALEWVSPVAPAVTQAAVGAGHWAAGRRRRALAAWASAAGFGLVAWGLGTEAPSRAGVESIWRQPGRKHPRPASYRGTLPCMALLSRSWGWSSACGGACATRGG
jgi:hypothetical protein